MTPTRATLRILSLALCLSQILLPGCHRKQGGVSVVGSTSVQPFAEALAEEFMVGHSAEKIFIQGGGSTAGIQAVFTGAAQVGMSSRKLEENEKALIAVPIIYDAIAVIVHRTNFLDSLSMDQVREIYAGRITRWKEVGGTDRAITVVTREEGSGTRETFQNLVMGKKEEISLGALVQDSNGAIRQVVADDPNAIGFISLGLVNERVKALKLDGTEPTVENVRAHRYQIVRPFLFVFKAPPQGIAKEFLEYVLSPKGQKLLMQEGLVSMDQNLPSEARK
ncbi:MAG TPA: phosphate ABC transporter substrate-binding protein [Thermodesulfobacteriota bacterium]|nr:phosphate ABC transporter substrate-binding protein [Thermodesulfobacteriota bacterium]